MYNGNYVYGSQNYDLVLFKSVTGVWVIAKGAVPSEDASPLALPPWLIYSPLYWPDGLWLYTSETGPVWSDTTGRASRWVATNEYLYPSQMWLLFDLDYAFAAHYATTDRAGRGKRVSSIGPFVEFRRAEIIGDRATWSAPVTVYGVGICFRPVIVAQDSTALVCWYMDGVTQHASRSLDDGRTWTELTGMMGANLRNVHAIAHGGHVYGCGVREGNVYFVWSNDGGLTQTAIPGGGTEVLVGPCSNYSIPCLVRGEDNSMTILATAPDDGIDDVMYLDAQGNYSGWWMAANSAPTDLLYVSEQGGFSGWVAK